MNLILVARRVDKLQELKEAVDARGFGIDVTVVAGDVCSDQLYEDLAAAGVAEKVDILVANAGE